jgi:hypothetical protein
MLFYNDVSGTPENTRHRDIRVMDLYASAAGNRLAVKKMK